MCSAKARPPVKTRHMANVLFLTDDREDYLADSLLHGLITLGNDSITDFPRKEALYKDSINDGRRDRLYGRGFTLYGLLDNREVDRTMVWKELAEGSFDIVILANIWRQWGILQQLTSLPSGAKTKIAILDGDDDQRLYPFSYCRIRDFGIPVPSRKRKWNTHATYFKRELNSVVAHSWTELAVPPTIRRILRKIKVGQYIVPKSCSFSIPEQWIQKPNVSHKKSLLPAHIVDSEVREFFECGQEKYQFESQKDYYDNLSTSYYGITSKRSGWDCLRHYEIAAAGTVPCFRGLNSKPAECAPHGLNPTNCVIYRDAKDLDAQLKAISEKHYLELQDGAHEWVKQNTTKQAAKRLLGALES